MPATVSPRTPDQTDTEAKKNRPLWNPEGFWTNVIKKHADTYTLNQKIDALVLHPVFGFPILVIILFFMFQAVFSWAEVPMEWIENGIGATGEFLATMLPDGILRSLVVDGIIAGIGSIIVFLAANSYSFFLHTDS